MDIVIANSRRLICDSVQMIALSVAGVRVVGQGESVAEARAALGAAAGPVTLIAGARFEDGDVTDLLRAPVPNQHTVVLTHPGELSYAREALRAGAGAVCLVDEIHAALPPILRAGAGQVVALSPALLERILNKEADRLTRREHEIMALLAEGLTNFQISARLGLSENTVKYYLKTIYQKLDVPSRGAAIARYLSAQY
jgi:two-component system nitrate/nitrite response regulator NarP